LPLASTMQIRNLLLSIFCLPILSPTNAYISQGDQVPIHAEGAVPGSSYVPAKHAKPTLADLLTIESSASIFYTYARETELSSKLMDENTRWTIFVPTNKAVMTLARKPFVFSSKYRHFSLRVILLLVIKVPIQAATCRKVNLIGDQSEM
jgi:hypothetical protein